MNIRAVLKLTAVSLAMLASHHAGAQAVFSGSYYHSEQSFFCSSSYACWARFPQLPPDKYTTIKRVHCFITRGTPVRTAILGTHANPNDSIFLRRVHLRATLTSTTDVNNYAINDEVHFLIGPGRYVTMFVDTSTPDAGWISCQLIGELSNGPPPITY
jgi:hypothetical protein